MRHVGGPAVMETPGERRLLVRRTVVTAPRIPLVDLARARAQHGPATWDSYVSARVHVPALCTSLEQTVALLREAKDDAMSTSLRTRIDAHLAHLESDDGGR